MFGQVRKEEDQGTHTQHRKSLLSSDFIMLPSLRNLRFFPHWSCTALQNTELLPLSLQDVAFSTVIQSSQSTKYRSQQSKKNRHLSAWLPTSQDSSRFLVLLILAIYFLSLFLRCGDVMFNLHSAPGPNIGQATQSIAMSQPSFPVLVDNQLYVLNK